MAQSADYRGAWPPREASKDVTERATVESGEGSDSQALHSTPTVVILWWSYPDGPSRAGPPGVALPWWLSSTGSPGVVLLGPGGSAGLALQEWSF